MKRLYICSNPKLVERQLQGEVLTLASAGQLRDDISTDEITPVAILSYYDERLGEFAHTGLYCEGEYPIQRKALQNGAYSIIVAGNRYGKGSSREHSPTAEKLAGVRVVFAKSFERIYRQNADNIGLLTSTNFDLLARIERHEFADIESLIPELLQDREAQAATILRAGGLLAWGQQHLKSMPLPALAASSKQPQTLFEKIIARHQLKNNGQSVWARADWRFIHEYYTGMAHNLLLGALGKDFQLVQPERIVVFEDHSSYIDESPAHIRMGLVPQMRAMQMAQREFADRFNLKTHRTLTDEEAEQAALHEAMLDKASHRAGNQTGNHAGISHAMMLEHYALPGQLVVGTDSHTPHSGALGCVAVGVGTTDMANAFVTGAVRVPVPEAIRIDLQGRLPAGVMAKDLVLHLLALPWIKNGGGVGKVFEFAGEGARALAIDERATLTNMCAELGGLTGIVAPDQETVRFLKERRGIDFEIEDWMHSDADAVYTKTITVDLQSLSPMVARPGDPGLGVALHDLAQRVRIDIAYGGSCTAGKREDFDAYHAVLAWGLAAGLRIPEHVQLFLQYGTTDVRDYCIQQGYDKTFAAMKARILQPSCGACANCGPGSSTTSSQVTVSAINRNFAGRSGPGKVWLASPFTVMASALAGELVSWDALKASNMRDSAEQAHGARHA